MTTQKELQLIKVTKETRQSFARIRSATVVNEISTSEMNNKSRELMHLYALFFIKHNNPALLKDSDLDNSQSAYDLDRFNNEYLSSIFPLTINNQRINETYLYPLYSLLHIIAFTKNKKISDNYLLNNFKTETHEIFGLLSSAMFGLSLISYYFNLPVNAVAIDKGKKDVFFLKPQKQYVTIVDDIIGSQAQRFSNILKTQGYRTNIINILGQN